MLYYTIMAPARPDIQPVQLRFLSHTVSEDDGDDETCCWFILLFTTRYTDDRPTGNTEGQEAKQ